MKIHFALGLIVLLSLAGCGSEPAPAPASAPAEPAAPAPPPNEEAAIAAVKEVVEAQSVYFQRNRRYALDYEELITAKFLREEPNPASTGYTIAMRPSADAARFTVSAAPNSPSASARYLFTDQTGEIHAEPGRNATIDSPRI